MKCGHCKRDDSTITVAHVRSCALTTGVMDIGTFAATRPVATPAPVHTSNPVQMTGQEINNQTARILADQIPAGRYAIRQNEVIKFYKITKPTEGKWTGFTFIEVQASDDFHPVRNLASRIGVLSEIVSAGVKESTLLYGTELGVCGVCSRTLTDEDSRAFGVGPVCRNKLGW